jgi:hypothetical protein
MSVSTAGRDDKYKQLGSFIEQCTRSLRSPVDELFDCIAKLRELEKALDEYESTVIN